ncbi:hypothetical protein GCM10010234_76840 [Streptomyces hawaiiensis]
MAVAVAPERVSDWVHAVVKGVAAAAIAAVPAVSIVRRSMGPPGGSVLGDGVTGVRVPWSGPGREVSVTVSASSVRQGLNP